ncbi:MAG TPA: GTPase HflX [Hydrogenophilus thermoluteolus]|jgi:GTP-binding protein HflX|uniref:GTPase HflX n=1 Tax=Hydrogenophilus thermoluteolus TaxID=297 RepID=UPI000EE9F71A|nr:GTPase HflX [Hydrogenophilus thermoluteolus]GLW60929.1 GTPase HflX [Hydrogenophilus thermoluteolus]HCO76870.1 GTPase HflX [Rhodocyclaceae bacterium]HNQ48208.1 GTPase HflX [Hydrogenophilus thermoluteolus]HNU18934.1 GTPase HflX [Hydrogenophilus thermoluteolus]
MFERPRFGERAWLVQIDFGEGRVAERLEELRQLVVSAGAEIVGALTVRRAKPDPATFLGSGKVTELAALVREHGADLVVFNHALSPAQQRNLEQALACRVVDRNTLILDIFALRAKSAEGKLQVELAQLEYLSTRLVRGWTHLERQRGGIGLRGPGETQLETDRRLIGARVNRLKARLQRLEKQRATRRRGRQRYGVPQVSLVGYTNAGKSTLFNALTKAQTYAADQLFATLDTTSRRIWLPQTGNVVLSDTVGFIRDLPHDLVAAFHATLEEVKEADLLLVVSDLASPDNDAQREAVTETLRQIGAESVPVLEVGNKIDLLDQSPEVVRDGCGTIRRVTVSAATGAGLELLRAAIDERLHTATNASSGEKNTETNSASTQDYTEPFWEPLEREVSPCP